MKILLIEDDAEISSMLKKYLETEGFEVAAAYDGDEACEKFFADTYETKRDGSDAKNQGKKHGSDYYCVCKGFGF